MHEDKQIEAVERELAARLGTSLDQLRAQRAHCPPIEAVRAFSSDTMPEEMQATVREHVANCATCGAIAADLQDDELTVPTENEAQRIGARVATGREQAPRAASASQKKQEPAPTRFALLRPALALVVLALAVWMMRGGLPPAPVVPPDTSSPVAAIPPALRLEMPELRMSAAAILVTRGEGASREYLKDLAPALDAYRASQYGNAARHFAALESKYPKGTEVFLYGGLSRLHEKDNRAAVRALEQARAIGDADFAAETSFYLALAQHRAENPAAARAEFDKVCAAKNEFSARACEASRALNAPSPR